MADSDDTNVAVIGGGVVGCAVAHALARRGVDVTVLEAEPALALGASGANSGILHTGFDSPAGELETRLILRAGALRGELLDELAVMVWRCGARLAPRDRQERETVAALAANARANGVQTRLGADGSLHVRDESLTDPVAFVHALAGAAQGGGARVVLGARVDQIRRRRPGGLELGVHDGRPLRARAAVNCAGLYADDVAALAGERPLEVYPRKGEFLVFRVGERLTEILLPVPSAVGKGVLVFPSLDGHVIAGPTAREREDKDDWSVEADARELILSRAARMFPALASAEPVGAYAGLRPAGRGANYLIEPARTLPGLIHVAAIRSTGLSASLAIGEHVTALLAAHAGVQLGPVRSLPAPPGPAPAGPWWERAAAHHAGPRGARAST
ncbi:MAG TPA: FAD-dependent oxidoreductase [Solirubrobacteraceae bacterium]|jgi:glycerol-3-phosphate dehydrogenase